MRPLWLLGLLFILAALVSLFTDHNRITASLIVIGSILNIIDQRIRSREAKGNATQS